jgi:hypothetical protein
MEKWTIPGEFPSPNIFSSFICNKRTRSVLPTLFLLHPSFSLLFQEVKIFIWIPWFVCSRLLEYGLTPVSIIRLRVQKLISPFLPKMLHDKKILWKFRRSLAFFHSFHTIVQRTKYSCFLAISPDFLPTSYSLVRLRSTDLKLLRNSTCKISLFSTSYSTKNFKNPSKHNTFRNNTSFYLPIYKVRRFKVTDLKITYRVK